MVTRATARGAAFVLALSGLCSLGCSEETIEIPEELVGQPYCMIVAAAWGTFADGTGTTILVGNQSPAGCACVDPDQLESKETLARLNELAYAACEEAAKQWDFVWNNCLESREAEAWLQSLRYVGEGSQFPNFRPRDLHCYDN